MKGKGEIKIRERKGAVRRERSKCGGWKKGFLKPYTDHGWMWPRKIRGRVRREPFPSRRGGGIMTEKRFFVKSECAHCNKIKQERRAIRRSYKEE